MEKVGMGMGRCSGRDMGMKYANDNDAEMRQ